MSLKNRQLLRDQFLVELVEGARKLRHVFLFTDLLLCAKLKKQTGGQVNLHQTFFTCRNIPHFKVSFLYHNCDPWFPYLLMFRKGQQYDCKWYIPLADVTFQTIDESESSPVPQIPEEEIDAVKVKISQIKNEIQREKVDKWIKHSSEMLLHSKHSALCFNCFPPPFSHSLMCSESK